MSAGLERLIVALIVAASVVYAFRAIAPFRWRVAIARALNGRAPMRFVVWLAGQSACEACGSRSGPPPKR